MFEQLPSYEDSAEERGAEGTPLAGAVSALRLHGAPRVVTTGRKVAPSRVKAGIEEAFATGERISLKAAGPGFKVIRHVDPAPEAPPSIAFIDALSFTVIPPDEQSYPWVLQEMTQFMPIQGIEYRNGMAGFTRSAVLADGAGKIAWGGESQRGRILFSLMGAGCSMVKDWQGLQSWLELHRATIKRADVAHDDHEGKHINIAWAVDQYKAGGFNAGGRMPRSECAGDWMNGDGNTHGRTLYIGSRSSGKLARCYEKGKQLGDAESQWTRIEVEWRAQDRHIPYDILTRPGQYLAGAYPCLAVLDQVQSVIKTIVKAAQIVYEKAVENAKQHVGKLINLMMHVEGGDFVGVVQKLTREGFPRRIDPYSYHVRRAPSICDRHFAEAS
jgi:phage replication initiation protein